MSFAPIFQLLSANAALTAKIGAAPVRAFPQGTAPESVAKPYIVFQQITGSPENYLNQNPDADDSTTQVDVYAETVTEARAVAILARNAMQSASYITGIRELGKDPDTNLFRVSIDVDWITHRT